MLGRAISALNALSPKLQFMVFPSGIKVSLLTQSTFSLENSMYRIGNPKSFTQGYGIHHPTRPFTAPFSESMSQQQSAASIRM